MGFLDFDNEKILRGHGFKVGTMWPTYRIEEENFAALQDLNRKTNSKDFSDSPFADRRE